MESTTASDPARDGDYLVRATAAGGSIRALAARTTRVVEEARRRHQTYPTVTAALGRVLTAAGLLGADLKAGGSVTVRVIADGPAGGMIADADARGRVRGYAKNPQVLLPLSPGGKLDVGRAVGRRGFLYVTRDLGLKEPYTGSAPLVSGEIAEDLTYYLLQSEQTPSAVALGVLVEPGGEVRAAGGLIVQRMPGADTDDARRVEENVAGLGPVTRAIDAGATPEQLVFEALAGLDPSIHEARPLQFRCRCSRLRSSQALISLGAAELRSMIHEDHGAELRCHFCNETYRFTADDLARLLAEAQARGGKA